MNASIGFVEDVTPAGTAGAVTGCKDHRRAARLANCSCMDSFGALSCGAAKVNPASISAQQMVRIEDFYKSNIRWTLRSADRRGDYHFQQASHAVVSAHCAVVKLVVWQRLPGV